MVQYSYTHHKKASFIIYWCFSLLLMLFFSSTLFADDTHYQDFVIGGRAVSLGGAFTAIADDPSGVYYNPAGLSSCRHSKLQVSTSLYGFERGSTEIALPISGIEDLDVQFTDLIIIPASGGFVNTLGKKNADGQYQHAYGVQVAVPSYRSSSVINEGQAPDGSVSSYTRRINDRSLWAGVGYSYRVSPRLQFGLSGFYILRSVVDVEEVSVAVPASSEQYRFKTGTNDLSFLNGSIVFSAGVRYLITNWLGGDLLLGGMVRSPSVKIHTDGTFLFTRGRSDPDAAYDSRSFFDRHSLQGIDSNSVESLHVRTGFAYIKNKLFTIAGDVSFHAPTTYKLLQITDPEILSTLPFDPHVRRQAVVNFNFGGEILLIKEVSMAAGIFSDFSSAPAIPEQPEKDYLPRVNLMGFAATLGYFGEYTLSRIGFIYSAGRGEEVIPADDTSRLLEQEQSFKRIDNYFQSFFYIYVSSTFRF